MAHVKTSDGSEVKIPSQGQVNLNTVLSSFSTLGVLSGAGGGGCNNGGILGGLFGGRNCNSADMPVSRYEMALQQENNAKDAKIALLEANIFTDTKIADVFERLSSRIGAAEAVLAQQAVRNQGFTDAFRELQKDIDYKVNLEAERRECADCKVVNYVNSTFAPKLITEYGAGTTSAAATTYNPLACGCGCK